MKHFGRIALSLLSATALQAQAQDILVTNDGESMKVYNLEIGPSSIFYQLSAEANAETKRIAKSDVLIIKKADGTKIDPNATETATAPVVKDDASYNDRLRTSSPKHDPVTAELSLPITVDKKGRKTFSAKTPDGHELNYEIIDESNHTLKVIKGKYKEEAYIIPEYVKADGVLYTVVEIGDLAFYNKTKIKEIQFPSTLTKIGSGVFHLTQLSEIILPDGLEEIGTNAFAAVNITKPVNEIYIPASVTTIGNRAFYFIGNNTSPRAYTQAFFSSIPAMVNEGNSSTYGIDDSAVKAYKEALNRRSQK